MDDFINDMLDEFSEGPGAIDKDMLRSMATGWLSNDPLMITETFLRLYGTILNPKAGQSQQVELLCVLVTMLMDNQKSFTELLLNHLELDDDEDSHLRYLHTQAGAMLLAFDVIKAVAGWKDMSDVAIRGKYPEQRKEAQVMKAVYEEKLKDQFNVADAQKFFDMLIHGAISVAPSLYWDEEARNA